MTPTELWYGNGIKERAFRAGLIPLSWLYASGWQTYLGIYRLGLKRAAEPHANVVCVGNLVTGGSGKSPLTLYLAGLLARSGKEVVVGCSGYGAPHAEAATLAPPGPLDPAEWGDEPAMFRELLPSIPLVVGRRRVLAAQLVHERYPNAVLVMDDGFQHLPLKKRLQILIDDPAPANVHCLPAGPYREPRGNRKRADIILPGRFSVVKEPMTLETPSGDERRPKEYSVLCALGQPQRFLEALAKAFPNSLSPQPQVLLPDHDPLTAGTLLESLPLDLPTVVTAKDWVKLRNRKDIAGRQFLVASQRVHVDPEADFTAWILERLHD